MADRSQDLFIGGRSGAGKSTVGYELYAQLSPRSYLPWTASHGHQSSGAAARCWSADRSDEGHSAGSGGATALSKSDPVIRSRR
jgi:hypothetical protein